MAGEEGADETASPAAGWSGKAVDQWRKIRAHAEEFPYVWASYILVYGGFGGYLAWRWRKLRLTEDRVKVLQGRLKKLVEEEEAATASSSGSDGSAASAPTPPVDKPDQ